MVHTCYLVHYIYGKVPRLPTTLRGTGTASTGLGRQILRDGKNLETN